MRTTACLLTRLKVRYSYSQPNLAHASWKALYSSSGHVGCMRYSSKMSTVPGPMRGARYSRISTVPWYRSQSMLMSRTGISCAGGRLAT